jgi:hypothetical protein
MYINKIILAEKATFHAKLLPQIFRETTKIINGRK